MSSIRSAAPLGGQHRSHILPLGNEQPDDLLPAVERHDDESERAEPGCSAFTQPYDNTSSSLLHSSWKACRGRSSK